MNIKTSTITALDAPLAGRRALCAALGLALGAAGLAPNDAYAHARLLDRFVAAPLGRPALREAPRAPPDIPSTSWAVTSCADDGSAGTMRWAVASAASGDTVDASALTCSTVTLALGAIAVAQDYLTIKGPAAGYLTVDAQFTDRVFTHTGAGVFELDNIAVTDGVTDADDNAFGAGGCIYSLSSVSLSESSAKYCHANGGAVLGGGIFAGGSVTLLNSTVSLGYAQARGYSAGGGDIYAGGDFTAKYSTITTGTARSQSTYALTGGVWANGDVEIDHSTISGNTADMSAGGQFSGEWSTTGISIVDSTISNNTSVRSLYGSGLYLGDTTTLANSTVSGNVERNANNQKYGAGVFVQPGTSVDLESTAVGDNYIYNTAYHEYRPSDMGSNVDYVQVGGANNLVYTTAHMLQVPPDTLRERPMLGPLQNNGGATATQMPLAGSPLINAGNVVISNNCDQRGRGFPRINGGAPDIGAVETGSGTPSDRIFADGFDPTDATCQG